VVFRLSPNENGNWSEKVLHEFTGEDGEAPDASLTFDAAGSLYGPTAFGGNVNYCKPYGCGVVFELTSNARGSWTESVPHRFGGTGNNPEGSLIFDESGNLYGTGGCVGHCKGVVFEISP
jgi:beta-xylosidase